MTYTRYLSSVTGVALRGVSVEINVRPVTGTLIAIALWLVALVLTLGSSALGVTNYLFFMLGIVGVSWFKGLRGSLLAIAVAIPVLSYAGVPQQPFAVDSSPAARFVLVTLIGFTVAFAVDTARRANQAAREARQLADELQHANAAKDEFLGMVSHELRTPLTIVKGNAEVLLRLQDDVDAARRTSALSDISSEATRLQWLIENMLVLARLEHAQDLPLEPTLLVRIAERVADEHRREHPDRTINIRSQASASLTLAHSEYVEQVIRNLVSNAHKYSPKAEPIEIAISCEDGETRVHVMDRGFGIAPGDEERIFEPFYRSSRTATGVGGMGLGLALCKRVIEAQCGRLWGCPREGGGSDFGFALPSIVGQAGEDEGLESCIQDRANLA